MKRVYVAGAYSADNVIDILKNIGKGEYYAGQLFLRGFAPFCPWHDKSYVMDNWNKNFIIEQFYDYSMAWLEVCDYMLVVPGYENSKGALKEIEKAKELRIEIFYSLNELDKEL